MQWINTALWFVWTSCVATPLLQLDMTLAPLKQMPRQSSREMSHQISTSSSRLVSALVSATFSSYKPMKSSRTKKLLSTYLNDTPICCKPAESVASSAIKPKKLACLMSQISFRSTACDIVVNSSF